MTNATTSTATAAVIAALSLLVSSGLLGAIFVWFRRLVEARIGAEHTATAIAITGEAVRAAEQIGNAHGLDGTQKYRDATARALNYLDEHGIVVTQEQLQTLVESAVTQIKQANASASMPGVVLTGDSPTVNAAPPAPSGPSPEQLIAAITTAIGAVWPQAPAPDVAPVVQAVPVAAIAVQTVPLGPVTS